MKASQFATISPEVLYFGTPVAVVSTLNPDGSTNLSAMSSFWALADRFMLGLTAMGQTGANLLRTGECVLNFPSPTEWAHVERLAPTTGRRELSDYHRDAGIGYVADKFAASGFTPIESARVAPSRVRECPVQVEARMLACHPAHGGGPLRYFEVERLLVHASTAITEPGSGRIDIAAWSPLFYVFRHYFGKGAHLGRSFRAKY